MFSISFFLHGLREDYIEKIKAHNRRLKPREHEDVLESVMSKIYNREIWIPDYEGKINKWYNKHISLEEKNEKEENI
ncbi:transposase [Bacillus cereus]|uniref:transposase n=1 Tax=Bacillus cereus TaxID=1396 RepID=UPI000BF45EA3|nr:transposase [Bacillus cereus]PEX18078.1 transposase [Bacillus cereus]PEY62899.1 transposase [Bacillus cereus]PFQ72967.1 transposase [Bacillus cereus]PFT27805.1 transposase [Bacillus cereus]PGW70157.1 transposase [Bacillus cereus]